MSIWYPAAASASREPPLPFRAYLPDDGDAREELVVRLNASGRRVSSADVEAILDAATMARADAERAAGSFPLVLFVSGLMAPSYLDTVLCEYLASYGFVVVAIPSLPFRENARREYDQRAVDTQIRDMELVIHTMHDYPGADTAHIGLVAWSFGGVSQALLQMKNPNVGAVVSLDAATGYQYGRDLLFENLYFDPEAATAPFFHATESRDAGEGVRKSFEYFDDIVRGDAYMLLLEGAPHAEFTSFGGVVPNEVLAPEAGASVEARRRYGLLSLYVRNFLAKSLLGDAEADDFLSVAPTRHGFEGVVLAHKR